MTLNGTKKNLLSITRYSSRTGRDEILYAVCDAIKQHDVHVNISSYELTLVVDEAVTNAMEHGNSWDSTKTISVSVWTEANKSLHVTVEDEGDGFDFHRIPAEHGRESRFASRGRGLIIIRHFCTATWRNAGRLIDLEIKLAEKSCSVIV